MFDNSSAHYAGPFRVLVQLDPEQPKVGNNTLTIVLHDKDNQPVTDAQIKAVAEMPAMGTMPAMPAPATIKHTSKGMYEGIFELSMKGVWPLTLEIRSSSTGDARLEFDLTTSRPGVRLSSATDSIIPRAAARSGFELSDKMIEAGKYRIQVRVEPDPPRVGKNKLTVIVNNEKGQPVQGAKVRAVAQMPAMGSMKAMNAPASISETTPGVYNGEFELGMRGEWLLAVDIESGTLGHGDLTFNMATGQSGLELATATPGDISHYTCSMHPSVKSAIPGSCPICAMDLVPVTKKEMRSGSISMDARRRQLIGVTTGIAEEKQLIQIIRAAGRVTYNEKQLTDITLKFDGWIGKLNADFVGVTVTKGQPLFNVYSPELLSAQQEYMEVLRRKGKDDSLLRATRQRLRLWDISPTQIRKLEKRKTALEYVPIMSPVSGTVIEKMVVDGSAVKAGQKLLRIADLSTVWVEGQIYEYEIPFVKAGMDVQVVLPELSGKKLSGKIAYIYPYLEGDTRTAKVRVELDNRDGLLKPDMYAHVHLNINLGKRLVVPESAVLYSGDSRVVFIDLGNGRLLPRKIKTGLRNADDIEVLEGLDPGDKVVTSGNFLIAAESKLKAGINQW
ncbi:MAG TPA: efflux RND transporter periplasmic adaptor subunit [Gammaproteobacteria bacterium]|nr:efflux RND transporter periplasmic adaptor subunit [Gammaproteobacteria bacterium]